MRVSRSGAFRSPRFGLAGTVLVLAALSAMPRPATAQAPGVPPGGPGLPPLPTRPPLSDRLPKGAAPGAVDIMELRRRLGELDRLLLLGSAARAESVLDDLAQHSVLERELVPRRIKLEQLKGDHAAAVALCRRAVADEPRNGGLWRELAKSLLALDHPDSARLALDQFLAYSPNLRSAGIVAVDMLREASRPRPALAVIDSLRGVLREPHYLGIERAAVLLAVDRQEDAADEAVFELAAGPFNMALLRTGLLEGPYRKGTAGRFLGRLRERATQPSAPPAAVVLAADLEVIEGRPEAALALSGPLVALPEGGVQLLQNAVVLLRERNQDDTGVPAAPEAQATIDYLLPLLDRLVGEGSAPSLRARAADVLAETCELALGRGLLGRDPRAAAVRFDELLGRVRVANPASEFLYSSRIRLAAYRRDVLHEPAEAARGLERLATDMNLPNEGLAMVRLTLGECYLAAGDTARGRQVLTALGRDPEFREAGGNAHYHLARLDLAEGNYATARDRFAVIAMDNPAAPYANDALDLGLALAEELENPGGGPTIMRSYAEAVYADLTAQPAARLAALERFVQEAAARLDPAEPQHLLERGRWELAQALVAGGRRAEALAQLDEIVARHPDGRYPAAALQLKGQLLSQDGQVEQARDAWQRLLSQYPGFLFSDDVRDDLRRLPH